MTTASDTSSNDLAKGSRRDWCCGTLITEPHKRGCPNLPRADEPVDYDGAVEVIEPEPNDAFNADALASQSPPKPGTALAESNFIDVIPEFTPEENWPHAFLDFEGDKLAYRIPRSSAVTGFSNSQSKYVPNREKGDTVQLFLRLHLSPASYERVIYRMMHPESDYSLFTLAKLVEAILTPGVKALEAELEAGPPDAEPADDDKSS